MIEGNMQRDFMLLEVCTFFALCVILVTTRQHLIIY